MRSVQPHKMPPMETKATRRLRKLQEIADRHGADEVAVRAGLSPAYLRQIIKGTKLPAKKDGSREPRMLGDAAARAIESAYTLPRGWFDTDGDVATALADDAMSVARQFDRVTGEARKQLFATLQNTISMVSAMQTASTPTPAPSQPTTPERDPPRQRR
jgi:AraC-like DNA-binding protein